MESVVGLVAMLLLSAAGIAVFVAPIALIVWAASRQAKRRRSIWATVAHQAGLAYAGGRVYGRRYGQPVDIHTVSRGSGNNRRTYTVVAGRLDTPLDLGLSIRRHGFLNDLFEGSRDVPIGDAPFDTAFLVQADEDHRARALLTPVLRRLLLDQLRRGPDFVLSDQGLVVERPGVVSDPRWLQWAVEVCSRGTYKLDRARAGVPPASPLTHHRHAWAAFATARGLRGLDTPLCMWGTLDSVEVVVYAVRTGKLTYALDIRLRFSRSLGLGLTVKPKRTFDRIAIFFGSKDHPLGDPDFDATFVVAVSDTARVGELLDPSLRAQLLGLNDQVGPVWLNDDGLTVRLPVVPRDPSAVPRTVHQLTGVVELIMSRSPASRSVGPYR